MTSTRTVLFALLSAGALGFAVAQTPQPPPESSSPSSASTPHQEHATEGKGKHEQMMKECVAKEQARDSALSKDDAKKNCKTQMKSTSTDKSKTYQ
jgi:hypothetical protein